ncbi:MAG: MarR family transcriptional regulator [Lautropia sp.]|nr:MarR family transcriptional regulator [Lautropia sp.]
MGDSRAAPAEPLIANTLLQTQAVAASLPEIDQSRLTRFLGFRLTRAKVQVHRAFVKHLSAWELRATEYSVLVLVDANPGVYLRQLASALDISPPNLVPVLDKLAKRQLIVRQPGAEDRRLQSLHLTASGKSLLVRAETEVEQFEQGLEAKLSASERRYLDSALRKLGRDPA